MLRTLLLSGDVLRSESSLRRKVLRFTGSRRATRVILRRIEAARALGGLVSCMVLPAAVRGDGDYGDEVGWDVCVSYGGALPLEGIS